MIVEMLLQLSPDVGFPKALDWLFSEINAGLRSLGSHPKQLFLYVLSFKTNFSLRNA